MSSVCCPTSMGTSNHTKRGSTQRESTNACSKFCDGFFLVRIKKHHKYHMIPRVRFIRGNLILKNPVKILLIKNPRETLTLGIIRYILMKLFDTYHKLRWGPS
jgi:hypothetical protein